jgi:anti-sigma B factor antagonist
MKISTSAMENDVTLLEVTGSVDSATAPDLDRSLQDLLSRGHSRLLVDASQISFISSPGLRALMSAQRRARELGGEVRLAGPSAQVQKVFEIAGLDQLFTAAPTRGQAMEGWGDAGQ